jgi:hypothetical protein
MQKVHSEWYWSEGSAKRAADRLQKKGYQTNVRIGMAADGRSDWLLEVFGSAE